MDRDVSLRSLARTEKKTDSQESSLNLKPTKVLWVIRRVRGKTTNENESGQQSSLQSLLGYIPCNHASVDGSGWYHSKARFIRAKHARRTPHSLPTPNASASYFGHSLPNLLCAEKKNEKKKHKIPGVPGVPHVAESGWGNDPIPSHSSGIDTPTNGIPDQMTLMDPRRVPEGFGSTTRSYPRR